MLAGPKLWLGSFRQYRVVVTRGNPDSDPSGATLTLLDAKHKFIAGAFHLAGFDRLLAGPAGLAALLHSGQLLRFQEIELNTQVGGQQDIHAPFLAPLAPPLEPACRLLHLAFAVFPLLLLRSPRLNTHHTNPPSCWCA